MDPEPDARANFAALVYGRPAGQIGPISFGEMPEIPLSESASPLPPIFLATAEDDTTVPAMSVVAFAQELMAAGYRPELHLYRSGGHGFGMVNLGTTSDMWADQLFFWMTTLGLTQKPGGPAHEMRSVAGPSFHDY